MQEERLLAALDDREGRLTAEERARNRRSEVELLVGPAHPLGAGHVAAAAADWLDIGGTVIGGAAKVIGQASPEASVRFAYRNPKPAANPRPPVAPPPSAEPVPWSKLKMSLPKRRPRLPIVGFELDAILKGQAPEFRGTLSLKAQLLCVNN